MNRTFLLKVLASTSFGLPLAFGQWGASNRPDTAQFQPSSSQYDRDESPTRNRNPDVSGASGDDRSNGRDDADRYRARGSDPEAGDPAASARSDRSVSSPDYGHRSASARSSRSGNRGTVWFTQSYPAGAQPVQKGAPGGPGLWEVGFNGASSGLSVRPGDELFCWVQLNSSALPREILLAFHDGSSWEHRAYWGQNVITYGRDGSASRLNAGALPQDDGWVKLAIPAENLGLSAATISGMTVSIQGGQARFGAVGVEPQGMGQYGYGPTGQPAGRAAAMDRPQPNTDDRENGRDRDSTFPGDRRRDDPRDRRDFDPSPSPDDR